MLAQARAGAVVLRLAVLDGALILCFWGAEYPSTALAYSGRLLDSTTLRQNGGRVASFDNPVGRRRRFLADGGRLTGFDARAWCRRRFLDAG